MSPTRIEVADLVVRYGDQIAVNGVSFTVGRGEHLTLLGPSGCGKTTTLRAIAGLEQPSAGAIRIDGQAMYDAAAGATSRPSSAACRWCSSPTPCGRT